MGIRKWEKSEEVKNAIKSRFLKNKNPHYLPTWSPDWSEKPHLVASGKAIGEASGKTARRKEFSMKKINYKGRCEKRKVSKCEEVCRTYSKIQSAFVDVLEKDEEVISFECNVRLRGVADDKYSSDFVIKKADGTTMIRECVWRINLQKPSYAKLLDISRNYWRSKGITNWGLVIEKKEVADEGK